MFMPCTCMSHKCCIM